MNPIQAVETRLRWLQWAQSEAKNIWKNAEIISGRKQWLAVLPSYEYVLEAGDTFYMNKKFSSLVNHARLTVPEDLVFDHTLLQSKQGWLWIEEPFEVPYTLEDEQGNLLASEMENKRIKVSAIGWITIPAGTKLGDTGRVATEGAINVLCYQNLADYVPGSEGFGCWSYFSLMDGDKIIDRIHDFEDRTKQRHEGGSYITSRETDMLHEIRWVYSAFYLMSQRLATTTQHHVDRHTRRRFEQIKREPPIIRVVTLRRLEEDKKKDPNALAHPVDWQWQWEVRGHWRNQFFPSTNEHKQVFIEAYIKGPDDKPLKSPGHKLFVAKR